jgi:hypothetical protein
MSRNCGEALPATRLEGLIGVDVLVRSFEHRRIGAPVRRRVLARTTSPGQARQEEEIESAREKCTAKRFLQSSVCNPSPTRFPTRVSPPGRHSDFRAEAR